ncbi:AI-2E family transporter [Pelagimonas varians]|uniref:AI-2 transport protein TqsA n=1 Tax=Pelagimonas varians TaxID=696760 RepID=A0A238KWB8_9RHOB|nr:AI-2E family transporter [Pelagimonas varians]PYG28059.1 putative PurR-regulated permease PerM [Pelagimonas varians]SMX46881.1 AI-2 transport protein TqsA [Pelagimonas varians]
MTQPPIVHEPQRRRLMTPSVVGGSLFVFLLVASLYFARGILMPIVVAILFSVLLARAADWLGTLPITGRFPRGLRRALVLALLAAACLVLGLYLAGMFDRIVQVLPTYEKNLEALVTQVAGQFGLAEYPVWPNVWAKISDSLDLQSVMLKTFSSVGSVGGTLFLISMYSAFLLSEFETFPRKIARAFKGSEQSLRAVEIISTINGRIADYLLVKTLINIILAVISYGVLRLFNIDFALFWAVLIGVLNYIPYLGSWIAVLFPVLISLGQLGAFSVTLLLAASMTAVQVAIGNFMEPWLVGRRVNISPFVVLVSLVAWTSLWGLVGAILAVPLTSAIAIICAAFPGTFPIAVFLSGDIDIPNIQAEPLKEVSE